MTIAGKKTLAVARPKRELDGLWKYCFQRGIAWTVNHHQEAFSKSTRLESVQQVLVVYTVSYMALHRVRVYLYTHPR